MADMVLNPVSDMGLNPVSHVGLNKIPVPVICCDMNMRWDRDLK